MVRLGITANGTPVDIFERVVKVDKRICLGNIEYHYFAGYSGGAKAIMPGVSTREAIQANHRHMTDPNAIAGKIENNPVRTDIESVLNFISVDFIVNVILMNKKKSSAVLPGTLLPLTGRDADIWIKCTALKSLRKRISYRFSGRVSERYQPLSSSKSVG
jgi:nickel-dependent lactate racemase